jgi:DNA-binding FrmR family transcriptional regulator
MDVSGHVAGSLVVSPMRYYPPMGDMLKATEAGPPTHQHSKAIADQLARTAGHVTSIKRMVEEDRPCPDVLMQLAAVRAAIDRAAKLVLEDHVESCLRGAASNGLADEEWAHLKTALDMFIR